MAWAESTNGGATYQIYARRWVASTDNWTDTARLVSAADANALQPALAMDASGNALLAWVQFTKPANTTRELYTAAFTGCSGWGTPAALVAGSPGVLAPSLAMNASGNAALAWRQFDGTHWRIWAARYPPGYGWSTPALIQVDTGGDAVTPAAAVGGALTPFQALVTWCQPDASGVPHAYANYYQ